MKNLWYQKFPIGKLGVIEENNQITRIFFENKRELIDNYVILNTNLINETLNQLNEYFAGSRKFFNLPLALKGTIFQEKVWSALQRIPFGKTLSYKEVAARIDSPNSSRAVGNANNKNPIAIVIPCHRVIGHNGELSGYAGGLDAKRYLLELENIKINKI
ncbi:MAG: methylated-DNA--[protein]-cysteine S-methyltransferase [Oscillospiraceae bacterium]|jgi:methylated-DNA-[protein]-cysteine S-methyltransferase|nr:methylated-DNA--[protein]-cysteine S-methyltransferase [Oscillospiraceae bacterium]